MDTDALIKALSSQEPEMRANAARIVGMVDETLALDALKEAYVFEETPRIRKVMAWAGQRLEAAIGAGYSTQEAIFRYFGVYREIIAAAPTPEEARAMEEEQRRETAELKRLQEIQSKDGPSLLSAASTANMMLGNPLLSLAMLSTRTPPTAPDDSIVSRATERRYKRAPAVRPSDTDIRAWVRRLREEDNPTQRKKILAELASLHNPAALPALALTFAADLNPEVAQIAQQHGKLLYWGIIYWQMEQDGSLQQEIDRRIVERQIATPLEAPAPPPPPPELSSPEDIAAILRKAEEARKRRGRGG
jgi:hypothetical protein